MRSGVEDIIARLDEGLVLADDVAPSAAADTGPGLGDQIATVRDQLTTEFDSLRELIGSIDAGVDDAPESEAAGGDQYATVDPDVDRPAARGDPGRGLGLRRLVEALRKELVALRRRIRLRAEGEILTDRAARQIADAVADGWPIDQRSGERRAMVRSAAPATGSVAAPTRGPSDDPMPPNHPTSPVGPSRSPRRPTTTS